MFDCVNSMRNHCKEKKLIISNVLGCTLDWVEWMRERDVVCYYWHYPHSMWSRVYVVCNGTLYVHLSLCPSMGPQQQTPCCRFSAVRPVGRTYQSIAAAAGCECRQCHVVSVRR